MVFFSGEGLRVMGESRLCERRKQVFFFWGGGGVTSFRGLVRGF